MRACISQNGRQLVRHARRVRIEGGRGRSATAQPESAREEGRMREMLDVALATTPPFRPTQARNVFRTIKIMNCFP